MSYIFHQVDIAPEHTPGFRELAFPALAPERGGACMQHGTQLLFGYYLLLQPDVGERNLDALIN